MTELPHADRPGTAAKARRTPWLLLLLPYLGLCVPALYNRATPTLMGFPFFYWYQFAWVVITAGLLWVVYLRTRQPE